MLGVQFVTREKDVSAMTAAVPAIKDPCSRAACPKSTGMQFGKIETYVIFQV
jgi:hypothetical protein